MDPTVTIRVLGMEPVKQFVTRVQWVAAALPTAGQWDALEAPLLVFECRELLLDALTDLLMEDWR